MEDTIMQTFRDFPIIRRANGSYVITHNGYPYHVVNDEEMASFWAEVDAWAQAHPEQVTDEPAPPVPTEEELLEQAKTKKIAVIDAQTSSAITAGFEYEIDPGTGTAESLHFSYDSFDQQNFADSANVAALTISGVEGLPSSVTWNAYRNYTADTGGELVRLTLDPTAFLALYTGGALAHKAAKMEAGGRRKAAVEAATTIEAVEAV
nr:MAG TPA: protein of unknown function (DUF4376) [Caudoviricetes sp.]